jgi:hypothetical protein
MWKLILLAVLALLFSIGVWIDTSRALRYGKTGLRLRFKHNSARPDGEYDRVQDPVWFWGLISVRVLFCAALDGAIAWDLVRALSV